MSALIIFGILVALMLTGMPISIALGLTVLTFLFTMTTVPLDTVALKLFTGIEKFEIMAIPFFILAGNFLTHGGVARRMINFATSMVGHWHGGLGLAGVIACALFAAVSGSSPATVVAISPDATVEERTGDSYYTVQVRTAANALVDKTGRKLPIGPGMVANVSLIGDKRTVLEYILSPLTRLQETAFRE